MFRFYSLIVLVLLISCTKQDYAKTVIDHYDFLNDFEAVTETGTVHVVIEIPAGSNDKWEVDKDTGHLEWEVRQDTLRVVPYLSYPANYGMVPRTWLPQEEGGDDDPVDIFLLGPAHERGTIQQGRVIGVIKMLDGGEQDDKLIAIDPESWFYPVQTVEDLERYYPGVIEILTTWLGNYKEEGVVEIQKVGDESEAMEILMNAIQAFELKKSLK